jgi:Ras-related protein Rab-6A
LNVDKWVQEVRSQQETKATIVIVGNKSDLDKIRQVSIEEGEIKSKELDTMFIETSAKTGDNVNELFERIARSFPGIKGQSDFETLSLGNVPIRLEAHNLEHDWGQNSSKCRGC